MKEQNKIFKKYTNLFIIAAKYTYARWWKQITLKDIFVSLLDLFSVNKKINSFFLSFKIDINKIISFFKNEYDLTEVWILNITWNDFSISKSTIDLLQNLDDIKNNDLFSLNLFLELMYNKNIIDTILKNDSIDFLESLNMKFLIDKAYNDKELKTEFANILDINNTFSFWNLQKDIYRIILSSDDYTDFDYDDEEEDLEEEEVEVKDKKNENKLVIDAFGLNLVDQARKWNLEPVVWREKEINQVIYTLLRKTKSNPLLIWEAWVGKTAIVEWLAQKIALWDMPVKLKNKKIYSLDMWTLVAWTKFRWEFEQRLKSIIEEAINPENNIILFVDEVHTVVWAWNQEGWVDTANMIKPYLARWELTLIWATTFNEYKKYIEKDPALTRRFQNVNVEEPSKEDAIKLLEGIKHRFEEFHGVNITKDAIERAVNLSKRYILDKYLPDKAIDLIDEACSRKSFKKVSKEKLEKINKLNKKIDELEKKIKQAVEKQDYFAAADYKESILKKKNEIYKLQTTNYVPEHLKEIVKSDDIDKVISEKYGVSNSILSKWEIEFLKDLKENLSKEIIWQKEAVWKVVNSIIRNKFSPLERTKPIWTFLFLWASWVGKTYLAKLLARDYFQDEKALIKINMSEYSQSMSTNQLIWSAAGYVWYEEWWILTEAVRKKPYSVVLFDEIEKWSLQVLNILLQILDNGYLEDNKGKKVDFKNTIIILTSNIWAEYFNKEVTKVWFTPSNNKSKTETITDEKKEIIMKEVENLLPIELINRFDDIVYFNPMSKTLLKNIFDKYYKEYRSLWKKKKWIKVPILTNSKKEQIIDSIYKKWSWVRWIENYIYNEFENKVIKKLMK